MARAMWAEYEREGGVPRRRLLWGAGRAAWMTEPATSEAVGVWCALSGDRRVCRPVWSGAR